MFAPAESGERFEKPLCRARLRKRLGFRQPKRRPGARSYGSLVNKCTRCRLRHMIDGMRSVARLSCNFAHGGTAAGPSRRRRGRYALPVGFVTPPAATARPMFGLVRALRERFDQLLRELGKFGIVGAVCYGIDVVIFNIVRAYTGEPILAKVVSTVIAATIAFLGNRFWTWRDRERSGLTREYSLYFGVNLVGLLHRCGLPVDQPQLARQLLAGPHRPRWRTTSPRTCSGSDWRPCSGSGPTASSSSVPRRWRSRNLILRGVRTIRVTSREHLWLRPRKVAGCE